MKVAAVLAMIIITLAGVLTWQVIEMPKPYFNDRCFANIFYVDAEDENALTFNGNVAFEFAKDKTGQFGISGFVTHNTKRYTFSRHIKFSYVNTSGNHYRIKMRSHEVLVHDNVPEEVSVFVVKMLSLDGEHMVYLQNNNSDVITVGDPLSPMFNCVIQ
jgi:hypothetical protein